MRFEFEQDEDGRVIAAYVQITEAPVTKTVEIRHGKLIVDEDEHGSAVGVEFLFPENIATELEAVAKQYKLPDLPRKLAKVLEIC